MGYFLLENKKLQLYHVILKNEKMLIGVDTNDKRSDTRKPE